MRVKTPTIDQADVTTLSCHSNNGMIDSDQNTFFLLLKLDFAIVAVHHKTTKCQGFLVMTIVAGS